MLAYQANKVVNERVQWIGFAPGQADLPFGFVQSVSNKRTFGTCISMAARSHSERLTSVLLVIFIAVRGLLRY
jgi:hypothetical protein